MKRQASTAGSHGSARLPWLTLALGAGLGIAFVLLGPAPGRLLLEPGGDPIAAPWRLLTGHLVHADPRHLAWNLGALLLLGALGESRCGLSPGRYLGLLLTSALSVDLWLWVFESELARYCGLSGVLNGLFAALAVTLWQDTRSPWALALLFGDLVKILVEAALGGAVLPTSSWRSVPGAHFAGLVAGLAWAIWPSRPGATGSAAKAPVWPVTPARPPVSGRRAFSP